MKCARRGAGKWTSWAGFTFATAGIVIVSGTGTGGIVIIGGRGIIAAGGGLAAKTLSELKEFTNKLPWDRLWGSGVKDAKDALTRLRNSENIVPQGISRKALEAYREIARRAPHDPRTEELPEVQKLRLEIIKELLKGM